MNENVNKMFFITQGKCILPVFAFGIQVSPQRRGPSVMLIQRQESRETSLRGRVMMGIAWIRALILLLMLMLLLLVWLEIRRDTRRVSGRHVPVRHHGFRIRIDGRRSVRHSTRRHNFVASDASDSSSSCSSRRGRRDEIRRRELVPFGAIELPVDVELDVEGGVVCQLSAVDVKTGCSVRGEGVGEA